MSDKKLEFINDWRRDNPRLAVVNAAFYARDEAFQSFSASVAQEVRPHLEELGIFPSGVLEAYAWSAILPHVADCQNFYRHGLVYLIHEGLRQPPECFDEMLNLESLCRFEIRIREAWPEFCERLHDYMPTSRKQIADLVTYRRKLPWLGPEPIPPLPALPFALEYLRMAAESARIAAYSGRAHPKGMEALKSHQHYDFAQRLFQLSRPRLAAAVAESMTQYLNRHGLLPGSTEGRGLFLHFLKKLNRQPLPAFFAAVLALLPESTPMPRRDYADALIRHARPIQKFLVSVSGPIKNLSEIPEIG